MREFDRVDEHLATNLRRGRETRGLSQDELAHRMAERGFGFSQATIWKIEQGKRPVKISELVALADALALRGWTVLLNDPRDADHHLRLEAAHFRASAAYSALKTAAQQFLHAQTEVAMLVHDVRAAGGDEGPLWGTWVQTPAERAVIEARIETERHDEQVEQLDDEVDKLLRAFRDNGYQPLINVDQITLVGGEHQAEGST